MKENKRKKEKKIQPYHCQLQVTFQERISDDTSNDQIQP